MTVDEILRTALELPSEQRRDLAEALWESLEQAPGPLPAWQRELLDERLARLEEEPEEGVGWETLVKRVWAADD